MFERIREQMGELMTEDDLKTLVDSAMKKAFFEPAFETDRYGNTKQGEAVFLTMLRKEMELKVATAVREWLAAHPEEVTKAIDDTIAKGMFGLIQQHMEQAISQPMFNFANELRMKGVL